jgi:hypothetical protein
MAGYYAPDAVRQLRRLSDASRVPQTAYLREALDDLLKNPIDLDELLMGTIQLSPSRKWRTAGNAFTSNSLTSGGSSEKSSRKPH